MYKGKAIKLQNYQTTIKTQTTDNHHADAIFGNQACYAQERVQGSLPVESRSNECDNKQTKK